MKISEVIEITMLTKKAINYYEEEGLIKPDVNPENNYREYSQRDIDKLVQISVLRQLDISVKDIKSIISKPWELKDRLEQHLTRLSDKLKSLEKSKSILQSCLKGFDISDVGISEFTKQLAVLNKSLEMDERSREGFMKRQLQRIFPGNFGRMIVFSFSPFLNEAVDTQAKEVAWLNMVKFLDEVESIEYSDDMKEVYEKLTDEDMKEYEKFSNDNVKKWINITDEELAAEKKQFFEIVSRMNSGTDMQSAWEKTFKMSKSIKEQIKSIGYYEKFIENLKILSSDYDEYSNTRAKFFKSLNVKMDDEGKIIVAE